MRFGIAVAGAVAAVLAGAGGWFLHGLLAPVGAAAESEEEAGATAPADMSVEVLTEPARRGDLTTTLAAYGIVRAVDGELVSVTSRAGGRIDTVLVRAGDDVPAGTPLFRIERAPPEAALAQSRAVAAAAENALAAFDRGGRARKTADLESAVDEARLAVEVAARQSERTTTLEKDGLSSARAKAETAQAADRARRELATAQRALDAYRSSDADLERSSLLASRDAAVAAEHEAAAVLAATEVLSPVAGHVVSVAVRRGERTEAGAELAVILAGDRREIAFGVTPTQRATIPASAHVRWTDADGQERAGSVRAVSALVDAGLGLQEILVAPDEGRAPPSPGTIVRGEIDVRRIEDAVLVPTRALVRSGGAPALVLVVDGVAKPAVVEILGRHEGTSAVKGEVKAGDVVVVEGGYNLPAGAHVRPTAPAPGGEPAETGPAREPGK